MSKSKELTFFMLDLQEAQNRDQPEDYFQELEPLTKDFIIGTYSPIMAELENIYKNEPLTPSSEMQHIAVQIKQQLHDLGWNESKISQLSNIEKEFSISNGAIETQLSFILQSIENKKNISEIIQGYSYKDNPRPGLAERMEGMFVRDFQRTPFKLVNQNGDIITENFTHELLKELKDSDIELNSSNIRNKLKEKLNLTDEQLKLIISRYNQRSIQSAGTAFIALGGVKEKKESREDIFHVNQQEDGRLSLMALEHKTIMQKTIFNEEGDILGIEDINQTSYLLDVRDLRNNDSPDEYFLALPTQSVPEILTYQSLCQSGNYELPYYLKSYEIDSIGFIEDINIIEDYLSIKDNARPLSPVTISTSLSKEDFLRSNKLISMTKKTSDIISDNISYVRSRINNIAWGTSLSEKQLSPNELNIQLFNKLNKLGFTNIKETTATDRPSNPESLTSPAIAETNDEANAERKNSLTITETDEIRDDRSDHSFEDIELTADDLKKSEEMNQSFLLYKEKEDSVMFISQACNDVDRENNPLEFKKSGGLSIGNSLQEIMETEEYKQAKDSKKKIEIHTPMSMTKSAYGISRAHWVTAILTEEGNTMNLTIADSLPSSLGYNFEATISEIDNVISKANELGEDIESKLEEPGLEENYLDVEKQILFSKSNYRYEPRSDQGLADHNSCGLYVIKYISEYAQDNYRNRSTNPMEQAINDAKNIIISSKSAPLQDNKDYGPKNIPKKTTNVQYKS